MANDPRFPEIKVNLVEQPGWKFGAYASDHAWEEFSYIDASDLEQYLYDLALAKGKKGGKPRYRFTSDQIEWLAEQVKEGNDSVEETKNAILDAMTWMYEAAYMPNKGDIQDAMADAAKAIIEDRELREDIWAPILALEEARRGPKEWSPRKKYEAEQILTELMKWVEFEQEEGHYDRYLVFGFGRAQAVHDLLARSDWQEAMLTNALGRQFQDLQRSYLKYFFDFLNRTMEDLDISSRTDWRSAWRSMLNSGVAPSVQKEMAEAVKHMPAEAAEDDDA